MPVYKKGDKAEINKYREYDYYQISYEISVDSDVTDHEFCNAKDKIGVQ